MIVEIRQKLSEIHHTKFEQLKFLSCSETKNLKILIIDKFWLQLDGNETFEVKIFVTAIVAKASFLQRLMKKYKWNAFDDV